VNILSPLWGDLVPAVNKEVYYTNVGGIGTYRIGGGGGDDRDGSTQACKGGASVVDFGKRAPVAVLDAIFAKLVDEASSGGYLLKPEEVQAFGKVVDQIAATSAGVVFEDS